MTMYVRTVVPMTITISSQDREDDVVLDSRSPYKVLPLWAAQRVEFQELWDEEKVEVATDTAFTNIITTIPVVELLADLSLVRGVANGVASLDTSGKVPANQIPNTLGATTFEATGQRPLLIKVGGNNAFTFNEFGEFVSLAGYGIFYDGNVSNTAFASTGPLFITSGKSIGDTHDITIKPSGTGKINLLSNTTRVAQSGVMELYNTADQTTNYERVRGFWSADTFNLVAENGGTGISRPIQIGSTAYLRVSGGTVSIARGSTSAVGPIGNATSTFVASSGSQTLFSATPTINQTGTAGYTALLINPTETGTGSGTKRLIDAQVSGVSRFSVDNAGLVTANGFTNATDLPHELDSGENTFARRFIQTPTLAPGNNNLRLCYFTARKAETIASVRCLVGVAQVGATLVRVGVYSVAANGDLTLVASTANDTALFSSTGSATKALSASFTKVRGTRYAIGVLLVGTSTGAQLYGNTNILGAEAAVAPRLSGVVVGQSDLAATITAASVSDSAVQIYSALAP